MRRVSYVTLATHTRLELLSFFLPLFSRSREQTTWTCTWTLTLIIRDMTYYHMWPLAVTVTYQLGDVWLIYVRRLSYVMPGASMCGIAHMSRQKVCACARVYVCVCACVCMWLCLYLCLCVWGGSGRRVCDECVIIPSYFFFVWLMHVRHNSCACGTYFITKS